MATGRNIQLNKQLGEYLVACELARRGLLVTPFSGSVPDFDIVAVSADGHWMPVQVKTIRGGDWQFSVDKFAEVRFEGRKQVLGARIEPRIPNLLCVLVLAIEYGKDRFFVLDWQQLRDIAVSRYHTWLDAKNGVRPKNHKSLHCSVSPEDLLAYENWDKITKRL